MACALSWLSSRIDRDPVRLLILNNEFPPLGGGAATATQYLLKEFASDTALEVRLITSAEGNEVVNEQVAPNIAVTRLPVGKEGRHHWTRMEILRYLRGAEAESKRLLREEPYDLAHAFFTFPAGWVAWRYRQRLPYIISLRGSDVPGFNPRFRWEYLFGKKAVRMIWRGAGRVVANSSGLRQLALQSAPEEPIEIIPNGVDTQFFTPRSVPLTVRSFPARLIFVGRLTRRKRVDLIIRAIALLRDLGISLPVTIIGEGEERVRLMKLNRELGVVGLVEFAGAIPRERIVQSYQGADIFLLPSEWEGMSNALLEAMACGLAVVVTDTGGTKELINKNGIILPNNREESIADALQEILAEPGRLEAMKSKSREIAENFTWATFARKYLDLYHEVAASAGKGAVA